MLPLRKIVIPNRCAYVNFSNPINGRQWLQLLRPDTRYGITFIPNLTIPKKQLGFSFSSNNLGLRGPNATCAEGVILGTSFAMGLSVDNGCNWYDLLMEPDHWFNAAMPVGPFNHAMLLEDHYIGSGKTLLYLYHPNLWKIAQGYEAAKAKGCNIFEKMGWKTDMFNIIKLYPRWIIKEVVKSISGFSVYRKWNGKDYHFNAHYSWFDPVAGQDFALAQMEELNRVFSKFDRIIAIRTPIKEDSLPLIEASPRLMALRDNYEKMWQLFQDQVGEHVCCHSLDHSLFTEQHFHPFDTHWNAEGNALFAHLIKPLLETDSASGLRSLKYE